MTTGMYEHYQAVWDDLATQRQRLTAELSEVDAAMAAIQRRMGQSPKQAVKSVASVYTPLGPVHTSDATGAISYARMSVRWAVLAYMAEVARGPMGSGAIADALQQRGLTKDGPSRFGNIVSAVVSHLKSKGEMRSVEDGLYELTEAGLAMWSHIKGSTKFRQTQDASSEHGLLDAQ